MKARFTKTTWRGLGAVAASFVLVVSFQNCGKAGFDSELDSNMPSGLTDAEIAAKYGSVAGAKVVAMPFAIDASLDTISYNSCSGSHLKGSSAFFSVKMGAYSNGGIALNNDFFTYVNQNFNPIYPARDISSAQYKEFLADSPANGGATPTMAIRVKNNLLGVYTQSTGSAVNLTTDVIPLVGNLTDSLVMSDYVEPNKRANYFPFSSEKKILEAAMTFNNTEKLQDDYRNILENEAVLALTYLKAEGENYEIRSNSSAASRGYGRGYYLKFNRHGLSSQANPNVLLSEVQEMDLSNNQVAGQWACRNLWVAAHADAYKTGVTGACPAHTWAELQNPAIRSELEIFRRHFPADKWEINVTQNCAYPKGAVSCYKEEVINNSPVVQYNLAQPCFRENGTVTANSRCLQYITTCVRTSN